MKWEAIVAGEGTDRGSFNCALCRRFWFKSCFGCPVFEKTGLRSCGGTPYAKWVNHQIRVHKAFIGRVVKCKVCLRNANAELGFLKLLRKEGECE